MIPPLYLPLRRKARLEFVPIAGADGHGDIALWFGQSANPADDLTPDRPMQLRRWLERFAGAGVDARRVNSPPLLEQLAACIDRPADALVVSLVDVEANLPFNAALLQNAAAEIAAAVGLLSTLCGSAKSLVVVGPGTRARTLAPFGPLVKSARLRLVEVSADYPLADPTLLLHKLLQRRLPAGALPTDRQVLLLDGAAAVAVGRLALHGQPMRTLPLAARDHVRRLTYLLRVPVGITVGQVCAVLDTPLGAAQLRVGELLRQLDVSPESTFDVGELTLHISAADRPAAPDPCIRCGWCVDACPTGVQPAFVLEAAQHRDRVLAEKYGLGACIGCGICTYVCPSRLPLLRAIRTFAGD
jgi:electron transport complex protein RnfC